VPVAIVFEIEINNYWKQRLRWSGVERAGLWYPSSRVFGRKNPQRAFLRRGSKAFGPMS